MDRQSATPPPLSHRSSLAPFLLIHLGEDGEWTVVRDMQLRKNLSFSVNRVATADHADDVCVREVMKCMAKGRKTAVCCTLACIHYHTHSYLIHTSISYTHPLIHTRTHTPFHTHTVSYTHRFMQARKQSCSAIRATHARLKPNGSTGCSTSNVGLLPTASGSIA
jgi:hypothetical protein